MLINKVVEINKIYNVGINFKKKRRNNSDK